MAQDLPALHPAATITPADAWIPSADRDEVHYYWADQSNATRGMCRNMNDLLQAWPGASSTPGVFGGRPSCPHCLEKLALIVSPSPRHDEIALAYVQLPAPQSPLQSAGGTTLVYCLGSTGYPIALVE